MNEVATHHTFHSMVQTERGSRVHSTYDPQTHRRFLLGKLGNTVHICKDDIGTMYFHHVYLMKLLRLIYGHEICHIQETYASLF
jgi:hypothetical protein